MLLAHLRGLLGEEQPRTAQAYLAEDLVLHAISMEVGAEGLAHASMAGMVRASFDGRNAKQLLQESVEAMQDAADARNLLPLNWRKKSKRANVASLVEMFHKLVKDGVIKQ
jgi:hypothetical protein